MFRRFIARRLGSGDVIDHRLLSEVLADAAPRARLLRELTNDLTAGSLQSHGELMRVASYFDIPSEKLCPDPTPLRALFRARNQIVHEMDIDFAQPNRNRIPQEGQDLQDGEGLWKSLSMRRCLRHIDSSPIPLILFIHSGFPAAFLPS